MRAHLAWLLVPMALAGCAHAPAAAPAASAAPASGPVLAVRLRALPDSALDYRLVRLARDIEQVLALHEQYAEAEVVEQRAIRVTLPDGMRQIPWPALLALDGVAAPADKPEWSADFVVPVAPAWLARGREQALDETTDRLRGRLRVLRHPDGRVRREGDLFVVEVPGLPVEQREDLVRSLTARPRVTFHLVDAYAGWMKAHAGELAQGGLTLDDDHWAVPNPFARGSSGYDVFWRAPDEAPLQLMVHSLTGPNAVPADRRLVVGEVWGAREHYYRTYFLRRRIELSSEDIVAVGVKEDAKTKEPSGILFRLSPWGTQRFADMSARNLGQKVAIVVEAMSLSHGMSFDARVLSAPIIDNVVRDGMVKIREPKHEHSAREQLAVDVVGMMLELGNLPAELVEAP